MRTILFQDSSVLLCSAAGRSSLTAVTLFFACLSFATASDVWPIEPRSNVLVSTFMQEPSWPPVGRLPEQDSPQDGERPGGAVDSQNSGEYEAYRATARSGYFIDIPDGGSFADDIEPIGGPIAVTRYEIVVAGTAGPFLVTTQLWSDSGPGLPFRPLAPILGTLSQFAGQGNGAPEHHSQTVSPPVMMPTQRFWIAYTMNGGTAGPMIVSDFPEIGFSSDCFVVYGEPDPGQWATCPPFFCYQCGTGDPCCTFHARVFAAGTEPTGACCVPDSPDGILCHDDVPQTQCAGRFALGTTCADEPFDPPCPLSACCVSKTNCMNLDAQDCEKLNGLWQAGSFCGIGNQVCPHEACIVSTNDCLTANHLIPGCHDVTCCSDVCEIDSFCCEAGWDESCVELALGNCEFEPPALCGPEAGDCCSAHAAPGCNDPDCCDAVCACDPFCCQTAWDQFCAGNGFGTSCGAARLCENQPCYIPAPPNDHCENALPVDDGVYAFSTSGSSTDGHTSIPLVCGIECIGCSFRYDIWYDFTAPQTGIATADLCTGTNFDSILAAYVGCDCPVLPSEILACDDDHCGEMEGDSRISFPVEAGECYKLRVAHI